jgi:hypothetical protein
VHVAHERAQQFVGQAFLDPDVTGSRTRIIGAQSWMSGRF